MDKTFVNLNSTILEQAPSLTDEMHRHTRTPGGHWTTLPFRPPQITFPLEVTDWVIVF